MIWIRRAILLALIVYVTLIALGSLWWPMGRDQGIFAWVGDVIVSGGAPYRDAWEQKGPATHYTYAAAQWLFGRASWSIRLLDLILLGITVAALWRLVDRWADRFAAHVAALLFPLVYFRGLYWNTAQPDGWAAMCLVVALALTLRRESPALPRTVGGDTGAWGKAKRWPSWLGLGVRCAQPPATRPSDCDEALEGSLPTMSELLRRIAAGVLVGVAAMYKPLFVVFLLPIGLFDLLEHAASLRRRLARVAPLVGGCLAAVGCFLALLALQGALGDFLEIQLGFNRVVHAAAHNWSPAAQLAGMRHFVLEAAFRDALIYLSLGMGVLCLWNLQRTAAVTLLAFLATALGCVALQNKFYPYHWWPAVGPVVIFVAVGLGHIRKALLSAQPGEVLRQGPVIRQESNERLGAIPAPGAMPTLAWACFWDRTACPRERGHGTRQFRLDRLLVEIAILLVLAWHLRAISPGLNGPGWRAHVLGSLPMEKYCQEFDHCTALDFSLRANRQVADYLRQRTSSDDDVMVWGFDPLINFLCGRSTPTRFGFSYPLFVAEDMDFGRHYRREFLDRITSRRPEYVVIADRDQNNLMQRTSKEYFEQFGELSGYVRRNYVLETRIERFELWRQKEMVALAPAAGQASSRR